MENILGEVKVKKLSKEHQLVIKITLTKGFYVRLALAKAMIWLASKILGCGVEFINKTEAVK